jgi:hypothetical protein
MTTALNSVASLAARAGGAVVRQVVSAIEHRRDGSAGGTGAPASGWLVVTVYRDPAELDTASLPEPLAAYGDRVETRIRPAADGKGTELAARLAEGSGGNGSAPARLTGSDAQAELRSALREAKQLIEVGEVLRVDPVPHGRRKATPTGAAVEKATEKAPEGGLL